MERWQRFYVVACGAVIGFAAAYALCVYGGWSKLTYFPYEGRWAFVADGGNVASNYLGIVLWGLGGALVGAVLLGVPARLSKRALSPTAIGVLGGWALVAHVLAAAFFVWHLWP